MQEPLDLAHRNRFANSIRAFYIGSVCAGFDHRVGHLISMTTEKTPDSIQRRIETR
jgi:hypothetical protein